MKRIEKINGKDFIINYLTKADESVIREIVLERGYKICEEILKRSTNVIFDIGAHIGVFSIYVRAYNKISKIYCFEPDTENFSYLKKNIKDNSIKNIVTSNTAILDFVGEKSIFLNNDNHNHSFYEKSDKPKLIRVNTVNRLFKKFGIKKIDLLKIDAEGSEYPILFSLEDSLYKSIDSIVIEYHNIIEGVNHKDLVSLLKRKGYKVDVYPSFYDKRMGMILCKK